MCQLLGMNSNTPTDVTFSFTDGSDGWQSVLYEDTDGNGVLSGGDARLTTVANLAVGESKLIFAKVNAAASLPMGSINVTTITASWTLTTLVWLCIAQQLHVQRLVQDTSAGEVR